MTVEFPDYPGLSLSREFAVVVSVKKVLHNGELGYWNDNYGVNSKIKDQLVNLDCGAEWKWEVPYALNDGLEEHTVRISTVRRGLAYKFLDYEASTHEFLVRAGKVDQEQNGIYRVEFVLEDSQLGELKYNIFFAVNCTVAGNFTSKFVGVEMVPILHQADPPLPLIKSVSQFGVVLVEFTKTMLPGNVTSVNNGTVWIN